MREEIESLLEGLSREEVEKILKEIERRLVNGDY